MPESPDITRLRTEYDNRSICLDRSDIYSIFNPSYTFTWQQRQRDILRLLVETGITSLSDKTILEVGCGSGNVLNEYITFGAEPDKVYGLDLLIDRLMKAQHALPASKLVNADGQFLPYMANSFDIVLQFTAFTSILDDQIKNNMAVDILRVLKQDGLFMWYDFWTNPTNLQTKGIRPVEIRKLFRNCTYKFKKITLAPPIARRIVPVSWMFAMFLESLKIFNSHYLVLIRKDSS